MRTLGLDPGTKRIGVAISDELNFLARPLEIIERKNAFEDLKRIEQIVKLNNVNKIIVGMPINMDGSIGEKANDAKKFAETLKAIPGVEIDFFDERLSTVQANNVLIEADISRKKRKGITDKLAAQFILQAYLDMKKNYKK